MNRKRVFLIGGGGYIGSRLTIELIRREYQVIVYDNFSTGNIHSLNTIMDNKNLKIIKGDIRSHQIRELINDCEFAIYQDGQTVLSLSIGDPYNDANINVFGVLNMLEACRIKDIKKVVFASSAAVYGDTLNLPIKEENQLNPLTPYGLSKKIAEEYMRMYSKLYGLKCVALRYFNVYGLNQDPYSQNPSIISLINNWIKNNESIKIYGDGTATRDFIHVKDIIRANIKAFSIEDNFNVFNIGSGREVSINELCELFSRISKEELLIERQKEREGDIFRSVADITKAKEILNFVPSIEIEKGIEMVYLGESS